VTPTEARTAPGPSRQSWGSSIARVESDTSPERKSGNVTVAPAGIMSTLPITPSGFNDQFVYADRSSSFARKADNGKRPPPGCVSAGVDFGRRRLPRSRSVPLSDRGLIAQPIATQRVS
jgi:hypothetical protein